MSLSSDAFGLVAPVALAGAIHNIISAKDWLKRFAVPLDTVLGHGVVFGAHKTWRGFLVMPVGAAVASVLAALLGLWSLDAPPLGVGLLVGLAYVACELPNSFLKRKLGIAPGAKGGWVFGVVDHLDSLFGCAAVYLVFGAPCGVVGLACVAGPAFHVLINVLCWALGLRRSWW